MNPLALGRLLRLSLAPSAAADVAAGMAVGGGGVVPAGVAPVLLVLASVSVYTGNMALNDWADRERDRSTRPDRPLPSGRVPAPVALALALGLQGLAVALAFAAAPRAGACIAAIALAASFYNLRGRGPWSGPLLLAFCRAANLGSGVVLAAGHLEPGPAAACLAYGLYVFFASRLGRLEDAEGGRVGPAARGYVLGAALAFLAAPLVAGLLPGLPRGVGWGPALAVAALSAGDLAVRAVRAPLETTRDVERTMGVLLRRLLVFTAVLALLAAPFGDAAAQYPPWRDALFVSLAILCGFPVSFALRKVFPPS